MRPIGRKGLSNHRWSVGGTRGRRLNQFGLGVAWACDTAPVPDSTVQPRIRPLEEHMRIWRATAFQAAEGDPAHLNLCARGQWNDRMRIETVRSMLTWVSHCTKMMHRVWEYFQARLAFTLAAFPVLVQWHGLPVDAHGFVSLSLAEFSL